MVYDQIFDRKAGRDEGKAATLLQILNPRKYAPEFAEILYEVNARAIAEQLLEAGARFSGEHAIFKPAGVGTPTPWHQDEAKAVACPLPPGGATFHDSRTAHFTGANKSAVPRRAYILIFGTETTPRTDGRTFPWNDARHTARDARAAEAARTLNIPAEVDIQP